MRPLALALCYLVKLLLMALPYVESSSSYDWSLLSMAARHCKNNHISRICFLVICICIRKSTTWSKRGSYLAGMDSFSSWLNIFSRREDALDDTSCVIFFRFLQLFNHTIPMDTWTVQVFCLEALFSNWYLIWSCVKGANIGQHSQVTIKTPTLSM